MKLNCTFFLLHLPKIGCVQKCSGGFRDYVWVNISQQQSIQSVRNNFFVKENLLETTSANFLSDIVKRMQAAAVLQDRKWRPMVSRDFVNVDTSHQQMNPIRHKNALNAPLTTRTIFLVTG